MGTYLAYLDESGTIDLNIDTLDRNFPVFTLACCIFELKDYLNVVNPFVDRIKYNHFASRGVVFHSYEIRKQMNEFKALANAEKRHKFMSDLNSIFTKLKFDVIAASIDKIKYLEEYPINPTPVYDQTFEFIYERLFYYFRDLPGGPHQCYIYAESREANQNDQLSDVFERLRRSGNRFIKASSFTRYIKALNFIPKSYNETGHQIADLVAYPISRHTLKPDVEYLPFNLVLDKIYKGRSDPKVLKYGLKIFPE